MKFGIAFANVGPFARPEAAVALARAAEAHGFESLWTVEHVVVPRGYSSRYPYDPSGRMPAPDDFPLPDPLVWLSFVAAQTTNLRLATGILILPQRNPVITAKEVATLDVLSGGRVILGVGVGWLREEFEVLGASFESRGRRTDEYVAAMRALWTEDYARFDGTFVSFGEVAMAPKPPRGSVPIVIGGHTDAAARRAGRIGDGFFPGRGRDDELRRLLEVMRTSAEKAGRDPETIEVTVSGQSVLASSDAKAAIEQLANSGVDRIVVPPPTFDASGVDEALERLAGTLGVRADG
ncbi:MAG: LLM class F420-dependent oxidoreductase [Acidimicrobiales bacterium]|nr:MAG: LLM class F420-dependent oxidoreductase [Acidimicrobiales bacterium]